MFRRCVNKKLRMARPFSNNMNQEAIQSVKGGMRPLIKMIWTEKARFSGLMLLSVVQGSLFLVIPLTLKEIQRLSNIRVETEEERELRLKNSPKKDENTQSPPKNNEKEGKTETKNEKEALDFSPGLILDKIKETLGLNRIHEAKVLSIEELNQEYIRFVQVFGSIFVLGAFIGFRRHLLSRKLDNIMAIILRRKLYREILSKNYELFIGKNINSSTVTQKIVTNVENVTTDLMMIFVGYARGACFLGAGSMMMISQLPEFTMACTALLGGLAVSAKWFNSKVYLASKKKTETLTNLSSYIGDQSNNIMTVSIHLAVMSAQEY